VKETSEDAYVWLNRPRYRRL